MNIKIAAALAALVLALSGLAYGLWQRSEVTRLRTYTQALENRVAGLESSEKALRDSAEVADRQRRAAQERAKQAQRKLDEALKAAPDWADQPVPDGIWKALTP